MFTKKMYLFFLSIASLFFFNSVIIAKDWQVIQEKSRDAIVYVAVVNKKFNWFNPYIIDNSEERCGTGFFIDKDGSIITCSHVVENAIAVFIMIPALGKQLLKAHVTGLCPKHDIALLHLDEDSLSLVQKKFGEIPYLTFGDSDLVRRGEEVIAFGYPGATVERYQLKGTAGVISARLSNLFQCDVATNPGNSGGPLIDQNGLVIGITCSGMTNAQNINFAKPINICKSFLPNLYENTLVKTPSLGIVYSYTTEEIRKYLNISDKTGCLICGIRENETNFHIYDVIYKINGYSVDNYGEINIFADGDSIPFSEYIAQLPLGTEVTIDIYRNGEPLTIPIILNNDKQSPIARKHHLYETIDYEIFAGMIIMPLTENYIMSCTKERPALQRYLTSDYCNAPRLVIANILPDSRIARNKIMRWADTINEVNGEKVYTLEDFRNALQKSLETGIVTITTTDECGLMSHNLLNVLSLRDSCKETIELSRVHGYTVSKTVTELIEKVDVTLL